MLCGDVEEDLRLVCFLNGGTLGSWQSSHLPGAQEEEDQKQEGDSTTGFFTLSPRCLCLPECWVAVPTGKGTTSIFPRVLGSDVVTTYMGRSPALSSQGGVLTRKDQGSSEKQCPLPLPPSVPRLDHQLRPLQTTNPG